ncbi:DUF6745 domain-containing protein [Actinoplanes solisilvae]|uniref:DUF6745 domain-containing protein n=1 Tax=Actinoplanes solisilvae TaxID=2486853 RepID=UPI000FD751BC|nr:hypothetical protein [Actinoplanes solisilvae]
MRLTDDQETMAAAVEDQWLAAALETAPANRPAAEEAVREAYRQAGLPAPERIFWLGSPRAGAVAAALLSAALPTAGPAWVAEVESALVRQGWVPGDTAGPSVRRLVRTEPWAAARDRAAQALGPDGWAQLSAAAGRRSWALVMDRVAARLRLRLGEDLSADLPGDLGRSARSRLLDAIYGQHDGAWLSTFEAADRLRPDAGLMAGLTGLAATARHCGWWWAGTRFAVLTERPSLLTRDNVGRLHRGEGPAMEFPDGYALWAWRGMPIPVDLAAELPTLTAARIGAEPNAELRRVMLEHFGYDRYLREAGAQTIHNDETGTLWHLPLDGDEPLVMVEVVNATPEPDGTSRIYWLRVPPTTRTAREGVAWTFGLTEDEYHPLIQT